MNLLEKIKINLNYLLGNAAPELYAEKYKSPNLTLKDWQKRWELFSNDGNDFTWYGVDSTNNVGQFECDESYIPETFFQDRTSNKRLIDYFGSLPDITTGKVPDKLREELKSSSADITLFARNSKKGIFIFDEANDTYWYREKNNIERSKYKKNPYELQFLPNDYLKVKDLPDEIQELLKPYHFKDLKFADCQFLDVSKYFYCEE